MHKYRVYIDQNIVGYFREYISDWPLLQQQQNVEWIYSDTHFDEIRRSGDLSFLTVFENLKAQHIEIVLDDKFNMTGEARIHPYSPPSQRYEHYLAAIGDRSLAEELFLPLLARLNGADNFERLLLLPGKFQSQLEEILTTVGLWNDQIAESFQCHSEELAQFICEKLDKTKPLETLRKNMGIDKGRLGNPETDNPIQEIWQIISGKFDKVTADRFFGFDPPDKQGYSLWPPYLGIVGCYQMLNLLGYRTDNKISSEEATPNIFSDAQHVACAAFCDVLMSEDRRLCAKARAIYKYKNIKTQVLQLKFEKTSA